ncbi:hypothetical protein C1H46_040082 [Malus baccata]|uniref:Proline dehydrogenase n=1 Tax=Malus baccata TaxID=106549 RepID=A0A540KJK6_MALBA|nr:hypothetical protein C1H46_040082 [Malus baccata]
MANRVIPAASKLLKTIRPLNSASSTTISAISQPIGHAEKAPHPTTTTTTTNADSVTLSLSSFDDADKLFASVSTSRLLRAALNLHIVAVEPMVDVGMWVMRSRLMQTPLIKDVILGLIRSTIYDHFCAGEDAVAAGKSVMELNEAGLRGMLVYALEYAGDNEACDRNLQGFLDTAESTKSLPPSSVWRIASPTFLLIPVGCLHAPSSWLSDVESAT